MPVGRFHNPYFQKQSAVANFWQSEGRFIVGSIVLVMLLCIYLFGVKQVVSVKNINSTGQQYLTVDSINQAAQAALQQRHYIFVKQSFLPLLDEVKLANDIKTDLSKQIQLENISVQVDWPKSINISLSERVPGYVYINKNDYYYLDAKGVVTQVVNQADADVRFPHIRERNKKRTVQVNDVVLQPKVIDFISQLHKEFTSVTRLDISEYAILPVFCQTKEYVTDKIFADEIAGSKSETNKEKKRTILAQLKSGEISVDQSLDRLEEIKRGESNPETDNTNRDTFITWETKYKETTCDYGVVIRDIAIITQSGLEIYFDSSIDFQQQLDNLSKVLSDNSIDIKKLKYIDGRFTDRLYYR